MTSPSSSNNNGDAGGPVLPDPGTGPEIPAIPPPPVAGPWGLAATIGWTVLLFGAMLLSGVLGGMAYIAWRTARGETLKHIITPDLAANGDFVSLTLLIQAALTGAVILLAVALRGNYPISEYLGLRPARLRSFLFWTALLFVYNTGCEILLAHFDVEVSPWMEQVYGSAEYMALLWLAVVIVAPLTEELTFRAFIFKGVESRLGVIGAIAITTALWAALHLQYVQWYYMAIVAGLGVVFGLARWKSGSIFVPITMHVINNLAASIQMQWLN